MFPPVYRDTRGPTSCTSASMESGSNPLAGEKNRLFRSCDEARKVSQWPLVIVIMQLLLALPDQKGECNTMQFNRDIVALAQENKYFRQEIVTGAHSQVVLMSIPPGGEIGEEIHPDVDQVLVFVSGEGKAILNGEQSPIASQSLCFVPAGTTHNFINTGTSTLKLYTVYAPPEHAPGTVHRTKAEADAAEHT